jgi:hypothetical protein
MHDKLEKYIICCTMSYSNKDDEEIIKMINKCKLSKKDFDEGISNFLKCKESAIMMTVFRCCEGFDDDRIDFSVRMYSSNQNDPVLETQRIGRLNRYPNNDSTINKIGYFCTLELNNNIDDIRKSLIKRFKSWILFAKSYGNATEKKITKDERQYELKKILEDYIDIDTLKMYSIDIDKDINISFNTDEFNKIKIKNEIKCENNQRLKKGIKIINTKSKYDEWAILKDYPLSDILEENGFNNFKWLFSMDDTYYFNYSELVQICKKYKEKYETEHLSPVKLYSILQKENDKIPEDPEIYYNIHFKSYNDLF